MDTFLGDLSLNGDLQQYIRILGEHGMHTFDDLMLDEPELEDLFEWGIEDIVDAEKIYATYHPEQQAELNAYDVGADDLLSGMGIVSGGAGSILDDIDSLSLDTGEFDMNDIMNTYTKLMAEDSMLSLYEPESYSEAKQVIADGNFDKLVALAATMDVNMQDPSDGNSLLHWAVWHNNLRMVQHLIENRHARQLGHPSLVYTFSLADLQENNAGKTPLEVVVEMIESAGDSSYIPIRNYLFVSMKQSMESLV